MILPPFLIAPVVPAVLSTLQIPAVPIHFQKMLEYREASSGQGIPIQILGLSSLSFSLHGKYC